MKGLDAANRRKRIKHYQNTIGGWQESLKELAGEAAAELALDIRDLESWAGFLHGTNESQLPRERIKRRVNTGAPLLIL